jgi:hypothetical protein
MGKSATIGVEKRCVVRGEKNIIFSSGGNIILRQKIDPLPSPPSLVG